MPCLKSWGCACGIYFIPIYEDCCTQIDIVVSVINGTPHGCMDFINHLMQCLSGFYLQNQFQSAWLKNQVKQEDVSSCGRNWSGVAVATGSSFMSPVISDVAEWISSTLIKSIDGIGNVTNAERSREMIQIGLKW